MRNEKFHFAIMNSMSYLSALGKIIIVTIKFAYFTVLIYSKARLTYRVVSSCQ